MDSRLIKQKKAELERKFGPWTGHNLQLTNDLYTIDQRIIGDEIKLKRILQIIADTTQKPLKELRVLDLACLEGLYAIELARQGATAVGIEGREASIEKARFAKEVLGLKNLEFFQDDVRNLSQEKYGKFDVVLCLGILYHLDAPDVFYFIEKIAEVCTGVAIIDTHISLSPKKYYVHKEKKYWGKSFREHSLFSNPAQRAKALWASIDNVKSFWPTRASLCNLLTNANFSSVYECLVPYESAKPKDRLTLLALKGNATRLISTPLANELPAQNWPEKLGLGQLIVNKIKELAWLANHHPSSLCPKK